MCACHKQRNMGRLRLKEHWEKTLSWDSQELSKEVSVEIPAGIKTFHGLRNKSKKNITIIISAPYKLVSHPELYYILSDYVTINI